MAKKKTKLVEPPIGRLCLITPSGADPQAFAGTLEAALDAGDVATLFIVDEAASADGLAKLAEIAVPIAQAHGVATIVVDDAGLLGHVHADGLHVDTGLADLKAALSALRPDGIVGAGSIKTRHEAMLIGETDCDYLFFGRFDGDNGDAIFDKALDLAAWWSAVFEIPAVVMGGGALASVIEAVDARIEFVTLRSAIWAHAEGAAAAVAEANRLIAARQAETQT